MGDEWDYRLRRMEMAWQLADRIMPKEAEKTGRWREQDYMERAQEVLQQAKDIVNAVFNEAP